MTRKHHTNRLNKSRRKAINDWKEGLRKAGLPCTIIDGTKIIRELTQTEVISFATGFNIGYKIGSIHILNPKKKISPHKHIMDALFRFRDPISFEEARELLGCSEKSLHNKIDKYNYIPTSEDLIYSYEEEQKTMNDGIDIEKEMADLITGLYNKGIKHEEIHQKRGR